MTKIYLIPTTLGETPIDRVIPKETQEILIATRFFIVENIKTARRYLRKVDSQFPIDDSQFQELNKHTNPAEISRFISNLPPSSKVAVISEAGCPGIADPGADVVKIAHEKGYEVIPMVGPSSILLALMGSGFSGQNFTFHGYIPKERNPRSKHLKKMEIDLSKTGASQIFMETPFRNMNLLEDVLQNLHPDTNLCIASNITCNDALIKTKTIKHWKKKIPNLQKIPCIFVIGK